MSERTEKIGWKIKLPSDSYPESAIPYISPLGTQDLGSHRLKIDLKTNGTVVGMISIPILQGKEGIVKKSIETLEAAASGRAITYKRLAKSMIDLEFALGSGGDYEVSPDSLGEYHV